MPSFGTFDLGDVYRNVEAVKGSRLRNRIMGYQENELADRESNRKKTQEINQLVFGMPERIDAYRAQGLHDEANDLQTQFLNIKKTSVGLAQSMREMMTEDNWSEMRSNLIAEGTLESHEMPVKYDDEWLRAKETKAKADYKIVTRRFGTAEGTRAEDFPVIDGVPGEPGKPYDPNAGKKKGAGAGGRAIKAADSNAIARAIGDMFGGFYDPQTGRITGLSKDEQQRVLGVSEEAERIYLENPTMGHRQAAAQAARNAGIDIKNLNNPDGDPLGLR